jgi:hypothetical protein
VEKKKTKVEIEKEGGMFKVFGGNSKNSTETGPETAIDDNALRPSKIRAVPSDKVWIFHCFEGSRIVTIAARCDLSTGTVTYGAVVFHREVPEEQWNRRKHHHSASQRLLKCPQTYKIEFPNDVFTNLYNEFKATTTTEEDQKRRNINYHKYLKRKNGKTLSEEELLHRVHESMIRDYVMKEMKRQTRLAMFTKGTTGKGITRAR